IEDRGSRIEDRGSRIEDRVSAHKAIFDPRSSILDPLRVLRFFVVVFWGGIYETQIGVSAFVSCIFAWLRSDACWRRGGTCRSYRDLGSAIYGEPGANQVYLRLQTDGREADRRLLRPVRPAQNHRRSERE